MPTRDARARTADLRAGKAEALHTLEEALKIAGGNLGDTAELMGFAGASTLWRVAYAVPQVKALIKQHGRRRGHRR